MSELMKYPKIHTLGHKDTSDIFSDPDDNIYIQEKIDGANFRFMIDKENIIWGSRGRQLEEEEWEEKSWKRCIAHIKEQIWKRSEQILSGTYDHFIFYGECCTKHSVHYDWEKLPPYLGYDIYDLKDKVFLTEIVCKKIFSELGLDIVPCIKKVKAGEIKQITDKDVPQSAYYEGPAEGIIFKNYAKQLMAKYVTEKFKEVNKKAFGTKREATNDNELLVAKYCTNPRIDKHIFKLVDDGHELDMPMMKYLPTAVYKDIMEEEGQEILFSRYVIDFHRFKRMVTHKCLKVLREVMANSTLKKG